MVNNQSLGEQGSTDAAKAGGSLIGETDYFLISVIVVGSVLFLVIVAIIAILISSIVKKKEPLSKKSKHYAPGSARRHYLANADSKNYLLRKYKCVPIPYMMGMTDTTGQVPAININPIYDGNMNETLMKKTPETEKSFLMPVVAGSGGSPTDGLAVPIGSLEARSVTSDLLDQLKDFQHMRTLDDSISP